MKCCLCKKEIKGYGNSPAPLNENEDAKCCDECNFKLVIPARIQELCGNAANEHLFAIGSKNNEEAKMHEENAEKSRSEARTLIKKLSERNIKLC